MKTKNTRSAIALWCCYAILCLTAFLYYPKWEKSGTEATLSWDVSGYYMYLPAAFIYKDIRHCQFKDSILARYNPTYDFQQAFLHPKSGNYIMKYSMGQAIIMLPFFGMAHIYTHLSNTYPTDGFSYPYQVAIGIGMFLYAFIGLFFLRKILLYYFKDTTVAILIFLYILGTNYLDYIAIDQAMTHNPLFTIYTLLVFTSIQFYHKPTITKSLFIGTLIGIAILIRPTEIIAVIIPLLWGIASIPDLKNRMLFIKNNLPQYLYATAIMIAVAGLQLIYWKYVSGQWVVYTYQDQGFYWSRPHILDFSFDAASGWLRYCPMMLLPFAGLYYFIHNRKNTWAVIAFLIIAFYIVTAWDIWNYGNFSGRAMIQYYPLLAFPFAALIEKVNHTKIWIPVFYSFVSFFTYLNIWWVHNTHKGKVPLSEANETYYHAVVGRWEVNDDIIKLLDNTDRAEKKPANAIAVYRNDFETDTSFCITKNGVSNKSILLDKDHQYAPEYIINIQGTKKKWLRVSADFQSFQRESDRWKMTQMIVKFYDRGKVIKTNYLRVYRLLLDGEQKRIDMDAKIPCESFDRVSVTFYHAGSEKNILIDNLQAELF